MSRYTHDQMITLERTSDGLEIWTSDDFILSRSYIKTRYGYYLKVIRIVSISNKTFYYLCEYTLWGTLKTIFCW